MANANFRNLFGATSDELAQETIVTQPIASTSSPVIAQENKNMTIQQAFDSARTYTKKVQTPSINLTEEQIDNMSPRSIFEKLITENVIGITHASNETRKEGIRAIFTDPVQVEQMARALAHVEHKIHSAWEYQSDKETIVLMLMDNRGNNDRAVVGRLGGDHKIYYSVHYANRLFNDRGQFANLAVGELHPIGQSIQDRCNKDWTDKDGVVHLSYNHWIDQANKELLEKCKLVAPGELVDGLEPEKFYSYKAKKHINSDSVVNKYQLEAWMLLGKPAFEIYTYAKDFQGFEKFVTGTVKMMERAYHNELKKLAGLVQYETENV